MQTLRSGMVKCLACYHAQNGDFNPNTIIPRSKLSTIYSINENTNEPARHTKDSRSFFSGFLHFYL